MGIRLFGRCSVYSSGSKIKAPNPNPLNFKILETKQVKNNVVAKILYPDCKNFEGVKICVFEKILEIELFVLDSLDPHFSKEKYSPIARFSPTEDGWNNAIKFARNIL